jgi:DNA (cytosine-5)-methyltransferase 1
MNDMLPFDFSPSQSVPQAPIIVDSFAGGGGASTGIEAALGRSPDVAINHDAAAISMHEANHPHTQHYNCNIWHADPQDVARGRRVGLAWFSPDCFPAGTPVLTSGGYKPIETIREGDLVLTHLGRWRRVTTTMQTKRSLMKIAGQGVPDILVSGEHPFYIRTSDAAGDAPKQVARWVKVSDIDADAGKAFWATPNMFAPLEIPAPAECDIEVNESLMRIAGQYLHAGHVSTDHTGLINWLRTEFGSSPTDKNIPGWALGMARDLREALLSGYLSLQTSTPNDIRTLSVSLAYGLQALAESLGYAVRVHAPDANLIYTIQIHSGQDQNADIREDLHTWNPVQSITETGREEIVFNLSVQDDESYVAGGIVVHNCTHHSKAKGGKPVSKGRRDLAWVIVLWAKRARPEVIMLENVEEFRDWGPLDENQRPCKERKGQTFEKWVSELVRLGYTVEWKELRACDYGAPTIRKRLFLVARCDGKPIVWPEPTHGAPDDPRVKSGQLKPYRTAADIIDWTIPCPSIFETKEQIKESLGINVRRPLADGTLRRIARGVMRYVVNASDPFIAPGPVPANALEDMSCGQARKSGIIAGFLAQHNAGPGMANNAGRSATLPISTLTTRGSQQGIVAASLLSLHGNDRRDADVRTPHPTLCAGGTHSAVISIFLQKFSRSDRDTSTESETSAGAAPVLSIDGQSYVISDIGMRMLNVPEMYRAQGFPEDYIFTHGADGRKLTKTEQTRMCGNSVSPPVAQALVEANCHHLADARPAMAA